MAFVIQLYIRFYSGLLDIVTQPTYEDWLSGSILMTLFWLVCFAIGGMYKNWHINSPFKEFFAITKTVFFGTLLIVFVLFSDNQTSFRVLFIAYFIISTFTFTLFRYIARKLQVSFRRKKIIRIPALIVGKIKPSIELYQNTITSTNWGYDVIGLVSYDAPNADELMLLENKKINNKFFIRCCK